jgi:hypothetical protein
MLLRFPVATQCPAPDFSPGCPAHDDLLTNIELRVEGLLREAAQAHAGKLKVDEVVADIGPNGRAEFGFCLSIRELDGDDPCLSLCRLFSHLLARLNLHL